MAPNKTVSTASRGDSVVWRKGIHLVDTAIWCDAARRRDVCFLSSADQQIGSDYAQMIATPETMALLVKAPAGALAVPVSQPFSIGQNRLTLFPTGAGFGAAGLQVETGNRTVVFAGAVNTQATVSNQAVRAHQCDALVIDAPLDQSAMPAGQCVAEFQDWVSKHGSSSQIAVVLVDGLCRAIDVIALLQVDPALEMSAHPSIIAAAQRCSRVRANLRVPDKAGAKSHGVIIWLVRSRTVVRNLLKRRVYKTLWLSALGLTPSLAATVSADNMIPWAHTADRDGLRAWASSTGAREIFVTGRYNVLVARAIGRHAKPLGPPQQMLLF